MLDHERKQITVLFADIVESTALVAGRDPDDARRLFGQIRDRMVAAIRFYAGTVHRLTGDGIVALFGAPVAYEDHALRACYSALRMQESFRKYAEEFRRAEGFPLQIRVGLNSGEVAAGVRGEDGTMTYSVDGETVHLAARMEQLTMPDTILMASQTFRLTEGYLKTRSLGPMVVRGLAAPVETYELLGTNGLRSRFQVAASRGLTRFVGRLNEMSIMLQAREQTLAGHSQLLAVVGEPGVGKSRLIHEFVRAEFGAGWRILETGAESVSYGTGASVPPVTQLLREFFGIGASDKTPEVREKVTSTIFRLDRSLLPSLPVLLALLEFSQDGSPAYNHAAPQGGNSTVEAIKQLLSHASKIEPLLVILEDLHAIDPDTLVLLNGLVENLSTVRMLFIVSYRPEHRHRWRGKPYFSEIRLGPFDTKDAQELLDTLAGTGNALAPLKQLLIERTAGNPFFLEESMRALVENGVLRGRPGGYAVTNAVSNLSVPATVESLLASRIDRLHTSDKRLLLSAAVIGYHVPLSVLEAVAELAPKELRQALERLQASGFLHETSLFPEVEYTFRHALVHNVAYGNLSLDGRRVLHAAALVAGERLYSDQTYDRADWLAFHAFRGQVWDHAVNHFRSAAARAIRRSASRVAVQHLENALEASGHLPVDERASLEIDLRIELRHALTPLGQIQKTLENLTTAEALASRLEDRPRLAKIVSFTANCLVNQGHYAEALTTGTRALTMAQELHDLSLDIATRMFMARARLARAEFHEAVEILNEIIEALSNRSTNDFLGLPMLPATATRSLLALSLAQTGDFRGAAAQASEAADHAAASQQPDSIIWAGWSRGFVALQCGETSEAVGIFEDLRDLCRAHDLDAYTSRAIAGLGCAKARLGQVSEGLQLLERAVEIDNSAEPVTTRSFALNALAEARFLTGAQEEAIAACNRALQFTREHEERGAEAYAYFLLGLTHPQRIGECQAAENYLQTAARMATEFGLLPLLAHCQLGLAGLERRQGDPDKAREHDERGHSMLNALRMKQWFALDRKAASGTCATLTA